MNYENIIRGTNEDEIWQQIDEQFLQDPEPLEYAAIIEQDSRRVIIDIDIDLGGGFEGGYETTTFTAPLHTLPSFSFAIHEEHFTDEVGKFFGMQDVETGYAEFDKKLVVKTNDTAKCQQIFSDASVREVFQNLNDFSFGITRHHYSDTNKKDPFLELNIESGITDTQKLREIYKAFYSVLISVDIVN